MDLALASTQTPRGINNIPVELLSSIFRIAKAEPPPHLGTVDIHRQNLSVARLTRVCRLWRVVAIQDSVLWSNISFSTSRLSTIRCAAEFLRRSRRAMLKVQIMDIPHCALATDLVEEIAQQSHRIVEFEAVGLSKLIGEALVHPANNLSRLTINGNDSEELPVIFGGLIPRLERLTLSNPSGWSLCLFPDITNAVLFCGGNGGSMSSLMGFLDGARKLEVLSLSRYRDSSAPDRKIVRKSIPLPHLRELNLSFCNSSRILGHLDLPPSAHVSILAGPEPEHQDIFRYIPNAPEFRRFLSDTQSLTIVLRPADNEFYLSMRRLNRTSCFLRVYDDRKQLGEQWILRSVNAAPQFKQFLNIESLTVSVEGCPIPWKLWLSRLDILVRIDVDSIDLSELILALSVETCHRPICPSLRYLSVERKGSGTPVDYSRLRSCLLSRAEAGCPVLRLEVPSEDWVRIVQADPRWKELTASQETTEGLTIISMRKEPIKLIDSPE